MNLSTAQASKLFQNHIDKEVLQLKPYGGGRFSETFYIQDNDSTEYIMRIAPHDSLLQLFYEYRMMRQEPAILERLHNETAVPAPEIVAYNFNRDIIDRDYLIMKKLPGKPLNEAGLSGNIANNAFNELGNYVKQIHNLQESQNRFGYVGLHYPMEPQNSWKDAFHIMYRKLLDDIYNQGIYDSNTYKDALKLLEDNLEIFDHCKSSRLCHGDIWVTNILVNDTGNVTGVIDYDRACWGDIEWDLAIAEYCGITNSPFWEGYGQKIDTHQGNANIRRMFYILYEHQKYIVIALSERRNDPAGASKYANEALSVMQRFKKTGQVAI